MLCDWPSGIFITGTDTAVGKTMVSALLVAGLGARYWKPVQCGPETDREWVIRATGISESMAFPETYLLERPLSPHEAARLQGIVIDLKAIRLPSPSSAPLVVEGAGGIMVPLNDRHFMLDLMKHLGLPVLLVASSRLGTINHTLLSLEQLRRHSLPVLGVVMNGPRNPSNRDAIREYGQAEILGEVEPLERIDPESMKKAYERFFMKRSLSPVSLEDTDSTEKGSPSTENPVPL